MRLEARVTVWMLVLLGIPAAVTLGGMAWFQTRSQEAQSREAGAFLALSVKNSLEVSMLNNAPEDIRRAVTNINRGTYIEEVSVFRRDGSAWVSSDGGTEPSDGEREARMSAMSTDRSVISSRGGLLSVVVPVENSEECKACHSSDAQILGAVGVTLDERPFRAQLIRSTRISLLIAAVPLLIGLIASLWALRRSILRPLAMVGDATQRLASGDLDTRLPAFRGGEFASVAGAFNDMAGRLQRRAADLNHTVEQLRYDLESMEEIQSLVASGAGYGDVLARAAGRLGEALAASGVAIWRAGRESPEATWGDRFPPPPAGAVEGDVVRTSAGALEAVPLEDKVGWVIAPASRGGRTLAFVGAAWDPPQPLGRGERDLLMSLSALVAVAAENADLLERLRDKEESLQGVLKKTFFTQEDERRRIARELHDETSQVLHALMMNIDLLERQAPGAADLRRRLEAVKALAEQAGRNLDKVLLDLRPALLDELGLVAALRWYVAQMRDAWGLNIEFEAEHPRRLPEHIEVAAFRIVQEALANAARHSEAQRVWVKVATSEQAVRVEVGDDGVGFDVRQASARARTGEAVGLLGMTERAELLGGRFTVTSRPGQGTRVVADIPLPEVAPANSQKGNIT